MVNNQKLDKGLLSFPSLPPLRLLPMIPLFFWHLKFSPGHMCLRLLLPFLLLSKILQ